MGSVHRLRVQKIIDGLEQPIAMQSWRSRHSSVFVEPSTVPYRKTMREHNAGVLLMKAKQKERKGNDVYA